MSNVKVKERVRAHGRIQMLPLEKLVPTPDNRRKAITESSVRSLAQSIKRDGLLQPLVVRVHPTLPGRWETINAVLNDDVYQQRFGLPDDYWPSYAARVGALTLDEVNAVAREVIKPEALTWVVVGDRKRIEEPIRKLNLGELRFVDADGNPVGK